VPCTTPNSRHFLGHEEMEKAKRVPGQIARFTPT
jgi:hypothetical protein